MDKYKYNFFFFNNVYLSGYICIQINVLKIGSNYIKYNKNMVRDREGRNMSSIYMSGTKAKIKKIVNRCKSVIAMWYCRSGLRYFSWWFKYVISKRKSSHQQLYAFRVIIIVWNSEWPSHFISFYSYCLPVDNSMWHPPLNCLVVTLTLK